MEVTDLLNAFEKEGFYEWKNFLDESTANAVREELLDTELQQGFKQAAIGKQESTQVNSSQRTDYIHWIASDSALPHTAAVFQMLQEVISELNRNFYLGIRDFECHYTHYPPGSFYKRHVDRHRTGSSRIVSFVLYLNTEWQTNDGGELIIYENEREAAVIRPELGTLAIFLSEKEHEVLITHRDRMSITGWMLTETIL
ncbi:MAG: 2OG-Fe(II) oxygenase [Flavobacteriales bacterium]|jgi:SM-20-related protein